MSDKQRQQQHQQEQQKQQILMKLGSFEDNKTKNASCHVKDKKK